MKLFTRLAALAVVLALAVAMLPGVALAEGEDGAGASSASAVSEDTANSSGSTSTVAPSTPATSEPPKTDVSVSITSIASYAIGTYAADGSFQAVSSVAPYSTGLVLRLYFNGTAPSKDGQTSIDNKRFQAFSSQEGTVRVYADKTYLDITGLRYEDSSSNTLILGKGTIKGYDEVITLNIKECAVDVPDPTAVPTTPDPTAVPDPRAPGLIVKSSSIGSTGINAGDSFTLSLTIYATSSGTEDITDVVVSIVPEKGVVIASGSSTQYIGSMKPGASQTVSFPMQAQSDFTEGVSTVSVSLSGTGATTGSPAAATGTTISVPVNQPDRFEISNIEVPESMMAGEENYATVTFVNKGKNPVNNLTFQLDAENCSPASQNQYVGNLAGGTEDSIDFDLAPQDAGQLTGTITITYEAANGETVTLTQEISCQVEAGWSDTDPGMWDDPGMYEDPGMEQAGLPLAAKIAIGVAAVAAVVAAVVLIRKRRAKKKALLEAENEDL